MVGRDKVFQTALESVTIDGLFLEFGVYKGNSINKIAKFFPNKVIHGFDSFEGLPDNWRDGYVKGGFSLNGELPQVLDNVVLHKGLFKDTLPLFLKEYKDSVAFVNFDADLYSSTKTVLDNLKDRLVKDTILYFDEFIDSRYDGEFRAFRESEIQAKIISCYRNRKRAYSSFAFKVK